MIFNMFRRLFSSDSEHSTLLVTTLIFGFLLPIVFKVVEILANSGPISSQATAISFEVMNFVRKLCEYISIAAIVLGCLKYKFKVAFPIILPVMIGFAIVWIIKTFNGGLVTTPTDANFVYDILTSISAIIARCCLPLIWAAIAYIIKVFKIREKPAFLITVSFFLLIGEGMTIFNDISRHFVVTNGLVTSYLAKIIFFDIVGCIICFLIMFGFYIYFIPICKKFNSEKKKEEKVLLK